MKALIKHEFFTDGSHGWLKVSRKRLEKLNILDKITSCSFYKGNNLYLEEDCDLSTYVRALLVQEGIKTESEEQRVFMKDFWRLATVNDTSDSKNGRGSVIRTYNRHIILDDKETQEKTELLELILNHKCWNPKGLRMIKGGSLQDLRYWKECYNL